MNSPKIRGLGIALGMFVAVYGSAFGAVSLIRPPVQGAVPLIIAISLAIALGLIFTLARWTAGISEFGLSIPKIPICGIGQFCLACPSHLPQAGLVTSFHPKV
jgi:hypothetical protein